MPDYGRFCPVALATEVLADRWTPMIVRELVLGNTRFNDIARGLPGISRTLLSQLPLAGHQPTSSSVTRAIPARVPTQTPPPRDSRRTVASPAGNPSTASQPFSD